MSDILGDVRNVVSGYYDSAKEVLLGNGNTTLRFRNVGGFKLDAVTNEEHQSDLEIADNILETGCKTSDHAAVMPKVITVTGVVVGYEPQSIQEKFVSDIMGLRRLNFLDGIQLPKLANTILDRTRSYAEQKLAGYIDWGALNSTVSDKLLPWLPDFSIAEYMKTSDNMRIEQLYRSFLDLQKNIVYCDVDTGIFKYTHMLLKSVRVVQTQDGSATFTLTFREVIEVPLTVTNAKAAKSTGKPSNRGSKKSGRADGQGSDTVTKDKNTTTSIDKKPDNRGVLYTLSDAVGFGDKARAVTDWMKGTAK